ADLREEDRSLYEELAPLAVTLAGVARDRRQAWRVRAAAATALGEFPPVFDRDLFDPLLPRGKKPRLESEMTRDILPTLGGLLNPANPAFVRRAAANALRNFMRLVSGEESVRASEPGVAFREARPVQRIFDPEEKVAVAVRAIPT